MAWASDDPAMLTLSSGSELKLVQLLESVGRADVVHSPGDERLHRALGGWLAALVREELRLSGLHEQRFSRG